MRDMRVATRLRLAALVFAGLLTACQTAPQSRQLTSNWPQSLPDAAVVANVPFFPQELYQCGPAALATALGASGVSVHPDALVDQVFVPGRQGSFQIEMVATGRSYNRLVYTIEPSLSALLTEVANGNPVLVLQNLGLDSLPQWHFAVVKGFERASSELVLNSGVIEDYRVALTVFERTWARAEHWGITLPEPGEIPATARFDKVLQSLVDLENTSGDFVVLSEYYRAAIDRWSEKPELRMGYANLQLGNDFYREAANSYEQIVLLRPEYAPAHNNLAHALIELGELDEAAYHAEQAVRFGGEFKEIYANTLQQITRARAAQR